MGSEIMATIDTGAQDIPIEELESTLAAMGFPPLHIEPGTEPGTYWTVFREGTDPEWIGECLNAAFRRYFSRDIVVICKEGEEYGYSVRTEAQ